MVKTREQNYLHQHPSASPASLTELSGRGRPELTVQTVASSKLRTELAHSPSPAPRLTVQSARGARSELALSLATRSTRRRSRAKMHRGLSVLTGDMAAILTTASCFAVVCALGVVYLAAFASVAAQGRQIHSLQTELASAQAEHEGLVQELAQKSSPVDIQGRARKIGMILDGPSRHVALVAPSASSELMQVADAR